MFKMISMFISVAAIVAVLLFVKGVSNIRLPDQGQILQQLGSVAGKENGVFRMINGQKGAVPGQNATEGGFNIASLLNGGTSAPTAHTEPAAPEGSMTAFLCSNEKGNQGESAGAKVVELPPGAQAIIVDGRLQVFYPSGKPRPHR
jgi:hypothetical protein